MKILKTFKINPFENIIHRPYIIAEAGVNHNGNLDIAIELIDAAYNAGADAVKFQTFNANLLVTKNADLANYQKNTAGKSNSQYNMLKKLELTHEMHKILMSHCDKKGILFMSSAFDLISLKYLLSLPMDYLKIPSGEINNLPYLIEISKLNKEIILSTGMSSLDEISDAVKVIKKTKNDNIILL